jgi:putative serine protease PepD
MLASLLALILARLTRLSGHRTRLPIVVEKSETGGRRRRTRSAAAGEVPSEMSGMSETREFPTHHEAAPTQPVITWPQPEPAYRPEEPPSSPFDPFAEPPPPLPPPPIAPAPSRGGRSFLVPLLAALVGAAVGTAATFVALDKKTPINAPVTSPAVIRSSSGPVDAVAAVAAAVLPSIVRIDVTGGFGEGTGSGVIYRSDGYIVTNNHVIENASDVRVTLSTGESLSASVVGTAAPQVDIAVVKVGRTGLPAARIGRTADLQVGDLAVAIGSPFGLQGTVTAGVISALHRNITLGAGIHFADAIQTDAPINPGNSGGALANGTGEVVGINTAILSGSVGGNVGVGFAIPIEIAKRVTDQIVAGGTASLPFLGITGQNLPDGKGALVQEVVPGGPAERTGLQPGDIIVELGGKPVASMDQLIALLIQRNVGEDVTVAYLRGGTRRSVNVRLAARPGGG